MSTTPSGNDNLSDFGILNKSACDFNLRNRVIGMIKHNVAEETPLSAEQITEIATYINELEDALLRFQWEAMDKHQINELLKCSTGLDIEARANALSSMTASDA